MKMNISLFSDYFYSAQVRLRPCVNCEQAEFSLVTLKNRHDIALPTSMCLNCGLVQINPVPTAEWYEKFYSDYFWGIYVGRDISFELLYKQDEYGYKGETIAETLVVEAANRISKDCRFLDIGCGLGGLLSAISAMKPNWNLAAIEPSEAARTFVKEKTGIIAQTSNFSCLPYPDKSFDLITLVHVLEHVYEPLALLSEVRRVLADDGFCYIDVPDLESPHWAGKDFLHIAHIYQFDSQSLSSILQRAGLEIYRTINSPARTAWPWAKGYFVRNSVSSYKTASSISEKSMKRRMYRLKQKIDRKKTLSQRIRNVIGPGFPGPKTMIRIARRVAGRP